MGNEMWVQADELKRLANDINQQYGNIRQPPGGDNASSIAPNFNESEGLIRALRQSGASMKSYYTGIPGTVGYNSGLMSGAANQYQELDANGARDFERIMQGVRANVPAGPATGTGGGPPHLAPATPGLSPVPVDPAAANVDPADTFGGTRDDPTGLNAPSGSPSNIDPADTFGGTGDAPTGAGSQRDDGTD